MLFREQEIKILLDRQTDTLHVCFWYAPIWFSVFSMFVFRLIFNSLKVILTISFVS